MRASLLFPWALLASDALASHSPFEISRRDQDAAAVESWYATANRAALVSRKRCPVPCSETKDSHSSTEWFLFSDLSELASCNETMLLNMAVKTRLEDQTSPSAIKACTADYGSGLKAAFVADDSKASLCKTSNRALKEASVYMHEPQVDGDAAEFSANDLLAAGSQISHHLDLQVPSCTHHAIEFAYSQSAAIGVFAGVEVHQHGITSNILKNLLQYAEENAISKATVIQLCGADGRGADYSVGIVAASAANLPFVRDAVKTWAAGECVTKPDAGESWMSVTLRVPSPVEGTSNNSTNMAKSSRTAPASLAARAQLTKRADCKTTKVEAGDGCWAVANRCGISQEDLEKYNRKDLCSTLILDELVCCSSGTLPSTLPPGNDDGTCKTRTVVVGDSCGSLASKCGISAADFMKVNTKADLCANLAEGQQVCCTDGKFPDLKPKPDPDGSCAVYLTIDNDNCAKIAAARDLTVDDLEDFNKGSWGWNGCKKLFPDYKMCVSEGNPPMPANVPNAVCGPTVNDTQRPPEGTDLASLNPCPLNVCCNIWGQCGTTDDFCVEKESETGAPGTSGAENGCISNCGRDIIKGDPPANRLRVAYFEAWNGNRECLTMDVDQVNTDYYTNIHFSFADITPDFKVDISKVQEQFDIFKGMTGVKKVISFGGWDFSTMPGTYSILRSAVQPANRKKFKDSLIGFVKEHDLDGIDLDWEYPGAPDIPGIPSDDPENGKNYYEFLSDLKKSVGDSLSVSFAAPASYWYLMAYPIKEMAEALDYIIYMTYDLHGQWDYGNKWTSPGCEVGSCLRSHINETETKDALSMITKAGAPSNKVVVGVTSYGRSFKMAEAGCDSETCQFTGTNRISNALPGRCTGTGGYISNAEIEEIIQSGRVNKQWEKEGSNILVYNDTEWVAYMSDDMKVKRTEFYDSYNFGGTTDWAVDLQYYMDGSGGGDDYDEDYEYEVDEFWSPCRDSFNTLEVLDKFKDDIPDHCVQQYILDIQVAALETALNKYKKLIDDGYDSKFSTYERYVTEQVPLQVNKFMASDKVDKYFTCTELKDIRCCNDCRYANCLEGCVKGNDCKSGWGEIDIACPRIERGDRDVLDPIYIPNATFHLNDAEGFWKDIGDEWGVEESWIRFGKRHMKSSNGCQYAGEDVLECIEKRDQWWYNYPLVDHVKVYNPKDVVGDSFPQATDMLNRFKIVRAYGGWDDQTLLSDLVDATSLPGYSTEEAVVNMEKIVEKAGEIEEEERKQFILNFITGLLFWIPIVGEAAGAAGLTTLRTLLRLLGAAGEAGEAIYDIVDHPENAFMTVFSYLLGAGLGRGGFRSAANSRRGLTDAEYRSLGNVKVKLDSVQNIRGAICRR